MSVERARVIKAWAPGAAPATSAHHVDVAKRIPSVVAAAHAEAERVLAEARATAAKIVADATANASAIAEQVGRAAREEEIARVSAEIIAVRAGAERRAEREIDRMSELAVLMAERLIGEAIAVEPARIAALATEALRETRGARQMRIEASRDDVAALQEALATLGDGFAKVEASAELARGSLLVHTELGRVDARLAPQLVRLAEALREVLRGKEGA
jgi:flagellar biosynthesis/type III secretory pathway protein FliH